MPPGIVVAAAVVVVMAMFLTACGWRDFVRRKP